MLARMPEAVASIAPMIAALDERAAQLLRLLDSHPARHLLAEYEAMLLDRRPCVDREPTDPVETAHRLLEAMAASIAELEGSASRASSGR